MTPEQLKEATFLLCSFRPFIYQSREGTEDLLKFDHSQKPKQCSEGTYIEGKILTEDDVLSELHDSLCHQETWVRRCKELIADFFPDELIKDVIARL